MLRKAGTETPYSKSLNQEKRIGSLICAACAQALFTSNTKFESGTGWPSFYQRVEVLCSHCGGRLRHVFEDGLQPTGLRYCMNGAAMNFRPA